MTLVVVFLLFILVDDQCWSDKFVLQVLTQTFILLLYLFFLLFKRFTAFKNSETKTIVIWSPYLFHKNDFYVPF